MVTLKFGNEDPPKKPLGAAYRPPNSLVHRLSDGENWGTLAARYKTSAQALMDLNFGTHNPYEVNWCLREYVRCDTATADRYNWRFSTSSRNGGGPRAGVIFIQPLWYAVVDAAKLLSRRWWTQALGSAVLLPTPVNMAMNVRLSGADMPFKAVGLVDFEMSLRLQGATDDLATAWRDTMLEALRLTMGSIGEVVPLPTNAMPNGTMDPAPMNFMLEHWQPLKSATVVPAGGHFVMGVLGPLNATNDAAARTALWQYGQWWAGAMNSLQGRVMASGIFGAGTYHRSKAAFSGKLWATPGFLRGVQ